MEGVSDILEGEVRDLLEILQHTGQTVHGKVLSGPKCQKHQILRNLDITSYDFPSLLFVKILLKSLYKF